VQRGVIAGYAKYCLKNKFDRSGFAFQDCVNKIGRRLGYGVTNGRYAGVQNDVGLDGFWFDRKHFIVIEVNRGAV
jgi:hypothetical protein